MVKQDNVWPFDKNLDDDDYYDHEDDYEEEYYSRVLNNRGVGINV